MKVRKVEKYRKLKSGQNKQFSSNVYNPSTDPDWSLLAFVYNCQLSVQNERSCWCYSEEAKV